MNDVYCVIAIRIKILHVPFYQERKLRNEYAGFEMENLSYLGKGSTTRWVDT